MRSTSLKQFMAMTLMTGLGIGFYGCSSPSDSQPASNPAAVEPASTASTAPAWKDLMGTDDKQHSLDDLGDAKAVVVVFTCNHCPVAKDYEDRLIELANDYREKGVELVAINVNNREEDKLPAMKERAEEKGFTFAYLYDPTQQIAHDYNATVTPHAYLLDGDRKIAYQGAIDDNRDVSQVEKHHLREAIDAVLAGKAPSAAEIEPFGCGIKFE